MPIDLNALRESQTAYSGPSSTQSAPSDPSVPRGINISRRILAHVSSPTAAFTPLPEDDGLLAYATHAYPPASHPLPPDPQTNLLSSPWIIEACSLGTRYAVSFDSPLFDTGPKCIELHVPSQETWPAALWTELGARESVLVSGGKEMINRLGIARHLRLGLAFWAASMGNFSLLYRGLVFGSVFRLRAVTEKAEDMAFEHVPNTLERPDLFLTVGELRGEVAAMAGGAPQAHEFPAEISHEQLVATSFLSIDLALVSLSTASNPSLLFRFATQDPAALYRDLKTCLSIPNHPNVATPPAHVVTAPSSRGPVVVGFTRQHYPLGSLATTLYRRHFVSTTAGVLSRAERICWLRGIVASLQHVLDSPAGFCPDIHPHQFVRHEFRFGTEMVVLADPRPAVGRLAWTAPEIASLDLLARLAYGEDEPSRTASPASTPPPPSGLAPAYKMRCKDVLDSFFRGRGLSLPPPAPAHLAVGGSAPPKHLWSWLASTPAEREAATVFAVGKMLWCIAEGMDDVELTMHRASEFEENYFYPFPRVKVESIAEHRLVRDCTTGAGEWARDGRSRGVCRVGGKVFPREGKGLDKDKPGATLEETERELERFWREEIDRAVELVSARTRWDAGEGTGEDRRLMAFMDRLKLRDVWNALNYLECCGKTPMGPDEF